MTPRVLVVDDTLSVRMDLEGTFVEAGFDVTTCATIAEARAALGGGGYQLVALDVMLPDGDGVEFLGEIKGRWPGSPAVMLLTSEAVVRDRLHGQGADDYVGKPYDRAHVVARARELVYGGAAAGPDAATTVLVVESSPVYGAVLRSMLEEAGYAARLATTGEEGLRVALATHPSAAIVDARLPGINGATVIHRMRLDQSLRRMPTLMLTQKGDAGEELRALEAGADAFAARGADARIILARLTALLRGADHASPPSQGDGSEGAKRILLVHTDESYCNALATALRSEEYEVATALEAETALELLAAQPVDCLIVELTLPGRSGLELLRTIRAMPTRRETASVIVSGADDPATMIQCLNVGADEFMLQDARLGVVRARVRALLRRKQYEDERRQMQEQRLRQELQASQARAAWDLAEARAALLADLREKNEELRRTIVLLAAARDQAERESSSKSRFLASMSHELRTPLNAIIGFSELLEQELFGPLNERQSQYIAHVHASGRHLLNLINDVLDLSKIAAGRVELQREWIDAGLIAEAAIGIVRPLASKQGVELQFDVAEDLPLFHADAIRMRQTLYNLLSNAIKFTRAGGRVRLTVWEEGDQLRLAVSDTGVGIRQEDLPRLFQEFEQLGTDLADKPEGTGLGLALSRRLVQLHGGHISVTSEPGVGSTFTVSLPLQALPDDEPADGTRTGPLVLVVDDDPAAADLVTGHLRMAGLSIAWARTAEEAFALVAAERPAAITLDILMPGVDGWAVLDRLRTDPASAAIPVIVLSVVDDVSACLERGAADYLPKPVNRTALLRSLEAVGVPVERPVAVLVVGSESPDLAQVASNLRAGGHRVTRAAHVKDDELDGIDVVVVDGAVGIRDRLAHAMDPHARRTPWIVLGGPRAGDAAAGELAPADDPSVRMLSWANAFDAFTLCQAVRAASRVDEMGAARDASVSELASRQSLVSHLRAAVHRAERCIRQVVVVGAWIGPERADGRFDARAISLRLRPGDFVAMPQPGVVVLVVEGVPPRASASIAARLAELVGASYNARPLAVSTACYPTDAPDADGLLAQLLARLFEQKET